MNSELQEFFSLIGKAKKEKDDEFKSLVGEINIDSIFTQVKESIKEEKIKKEKKQKQLERQVKALESWLYSEPIKKEDILTVKDNKEEKNLPKVEEFDLVQVEETIDPEYKNEEDLQITLTEESHTEICDYAEKNTKENDTIDSALKILEQFKTKKEIQENTNDPEIIKIRKELEYLRNVVNAQGGGGEVRLEFLDDIDRDSAKRNNYYLKYDSLTDKWVGDAGSGVAEIQNLNQTLGYANTAGIATYASTSGISTISQGLTGTPNIAVGTLTASSLGLDAGTIISGVVTTTTTSETVISSINSTIFRSATYQIQITEGTNYNMSIVNTIHDGSATYISEYGTINHPVGIATFSTDINSGFLRLLAYPNSSNTTTFKVILTAIKS